MNKFYHAIAAKHFHFPGWGMIHEGYPMSVAKFSNEVFVIALSPADFKLYKLEEAKDIAKTIRNKLGQLMPVSAFAAPPFSMLEPYFTWTVSAGHTCPDGCCGDDTPQFIKVCANKEEALALAEVKKLEFTNPTAFVKVTGPAFSQLHSNRTGF